MALLVEALVLLETDPTHQELLVVLVVLAAVGAAVAPQVALAALAYFTFSTRGL